MTPLSGSRPPLVGTRTLVLLGVAALMLMLLETVVCGIASMLLDAHGLPQSVPTRAFVSVVTALLFAQAATMHLLHETRRDLRLARGSRS